MEGDSVTIRDVAKLAGVAVSTASRALGGGSASAKTRMKVRQAAETLHFVPNQAAVQLTSGRSNVVAIVVPEQPEFVFKDEFISGIVSRLATAFADRGMLPFLALTDPEDAESFERLLRSSAASGMVVTSFHHSLPFAQVLNDFGRPAVFIGQPSPSLDYPYVDVDSYQGGYDAGELLSRRGRRRIAIIAGPTDMRTPQQKNAGCEDAISDYGGEIIATIAGKYSVEHGERAMYRVLETRPDVDAVFAHSDKIALGVIRALRSAGRGIPEDVSVIGFDDFQIADAATPRLTTFSQPLADMANAAAEMLSERLSLGEWRTKKAVFPVTLVERDSV